MKKLLVCLMMVSGISTVATSAFANELVNVINDSSTTYYLYNSNGTSPDGGNAYYYGCANNPRIVNGTYPASLCTVAPHGTAVSVNANLATSDGGDSWGSFSFLTSTDRSANPVASFWYSNTFSQYFASGWGIQKQIGNANFNTDGNDTITISG